MWQVLNPKWRSNILSEKHECAQQRLSFPTHLHEPKGSLVSVVRGSSRILSPAAFLHPATDASWEKKQQKDFYPTTRRCLVLNWEPTGLALLWPPRPPPLVGSLLVWLCNHRHCAYANMQLLPHPCWASDSAVPLYAMFNTFLSVLTISKRFRIFFRGPVKRPREDLTTDLRSS